MVIREPRGKVHPISDFDFQVPQIQRRPVGAVRDSEGRTSLFLLDELLVSALSRSDVEVLAQRLNASIVDTDLPVEPPEGEIVPSSRRDRLRQIEEQEGRPGVVYTLRFSSESVLSDENESLHQSTQFDQNLVSLLTSEKILDVFAEENRHLRSEGKPPIALSDFQSSMPEFTVSSERANRLLSLVTALNLQQTRQHSNGSSMPVYVSPNFVSENTAVLNFTEERNYEDPMVTPPFMDALSLMGFRPPFSEWNPPVSPDDRTQGTNVDAMLQTLAADNASERVFGHALPRAQPVKVAFVDGGFLLNYDGTPYNETHQGALPFTNDLVRQTSSERVFYQVTFDGPSARTYNASGPNPGRCHGEPCYWHGAATASIGIGIINNRGFSAGTGGLISVPVLFKVAPADNQIIAAMRSALLWGVDVVSISIASQCDNIFCRTYRAVNGFNEVFRVARSFGLIVVASAGNDAKDSGRKDYRPCTSSGVICVGALDSQSEMRDPISNYGSAVTIWAPTNAPLVVPDFTRPDMPGASNLPELTVVGGTSISAPFVAGVLANLKFYNRGLMPSQVPSLLRDHSQTPRSFLIDEDYPDTYEIRSIDAYQTFLANLNGLDPGERREEVFLTPDAFETSSGFSNNDSISRATPLTRSLTNLNLHNIHDEDYFVVTASSYGSLDLELEFIFNLGTVTLEVLPVVSSDGHTLNRPDEVTITSPKPYLIRYHAGILPPGTYYVRVKTEGPRASHNGYNLGFNLGSPDHNFRQDAFESNESVGELQSRYRPLIVRGVHRVNLHQRTDRDVYLLSPNRSSGLLNRSRFRIFNCEIPLTITNISLGGSASCAPGRDASFDLSIDTWSGDFYFLVQGDQAGRYEIGAEDIYISPPEVILHSSGPVIEPDVFWFNPSDSAPYFGRLRDRDIVFAFRREFQGHPFDEIKLTELNEAGSDLVDTEPRIRLDLLDSVSGFVIPSYSRGPGSLTGLGLLDGSVPSDGLRPVHFFRVSRIIDSATTGTSGVSNRMIEVPFRLQSL